MPVVVNEGTPSHATTSTVEGKLSIMKLVGLFFIRMPYTVVVADRLLQEMALLSLEGIYHDTIELLSVMITTAICMCIRTSATQTSPASWGRRFWHRIQSLMEGVCRCCKIDPYSWKSTIKGDGYFEVKHFCCSSYNN